MSQIHVKENSKRIWIMHTSRGYIGLKTTYIIFLMFLGMIKETSKDKKWSMGSKESAARQGKAIQSVIHLEW